MFHPRALLKKRNIAHLPEIVFRLIERTPLTPGIPITLKRIAENSEYFPNEVAMVHLYCHPNVKENLWSCSSAGVVSVLTDDDLQAKIDEKEPKLEEYSSPCSEIWLLICC
jgi:hypothetical protein